jgi:LysM repeat protein
MARSIELYLDRTGVPSNGRLMREADMVTMVGKRPMAAMDHVRVAGAGGQIRTDESLPRVRLTRRGRIAVTGVSAILIGALSVTLATAAQATHTGSASPGRYVAKVTILPGQSLWSVAEAYDPNADTRLVIQEIQQLNSMAGDQVQPGEVLWVPRD